MRWMRSFLLCVILGMPFSAQLRHGVCSFSSRTLFWGASTHINVGGYGLCAQFHAEAKIIPAFIKPSNSVSWTTESLSSAIIPAMEAAYNSAPDPKRVKAVLTSNPSNPMMNCWPKDVVRQMMDFCHDRNLHYISDEVFANTVFDPEADQFVSALSLLKTPDQDKESTEVKSSIEPSLVHIVWSTTKDFGACGVRAVGPAFLFLLFPDLLFSHSRNSILTIYTGLCPHISPACSCRCLFCNSMANLFVDRTLYASPSHLTLNTGSPLFGAVSTRSVLSNVP